MILDRFLPNFKKQTNSAKTFDFQENYAIIGLKHGMDHVADVLRIIPNEFLQLLLLDSNFSKNIVYFLLSPINDFVLGRYEEVVEVTKTSKEKFDSGMAKQSKYFYVSKIRTGVVILLRVVPKRPVDLESVLAYLRDGNMKVSLNDADFYIETLANWTIFKRHDTLKDALKYMDRIEIPFCNLRYQLKSIGKAKTIREIENYHCQYYLEQLFGIEFCCLLVDNVLIKAGMSSSAYSSTDSFSVAAENLKQHLEFLKTPNFTGLFQNITSLYPDLLAFRQCFYQEVRHHLAA
uniref:Uncharacterized protein n=1 Tax=Panagrolaimus sp. JU765 TaxID=591449 RepID=A0AC34QZP3_9BILA